MRYDEDRPTLYTEIGERIHLARRRAELSQRDLGQRLGISHVAVGALERAKTKSNLDNLAAVAAAIGVELADIVVLERKLRPAQVALGVADGGQGEGEMNALADTDRCPMCSHRFHRHGERGCEVVMAVGTSRRVRCRCTMTASQLWSPA